MCSRKSNSCAIGLRIGRPIHSRFPPISKLDELVLRSRICFFTCENGSGKSTLLEAMAIHYGFGREGGTRSFSVDTTESDHSVDVLVRALRLSFILRTGRGFVLRAESFFNSASYLDAIDGGSGDVLRYYSGRSLHDHSHGETFSNFSNSGSSATVFSS